MLSGYGVYSGIFFWGGFFAVVKESAAKLLQQCNDDFLLIIGVVQGQTVLFPFLCVFCCIEPAVCKAEIPANEGQSEGFPLPHCYH